MKVSEHISNTVSNLRNINKITQEELARSTNVTRQTVISIEKGNYTPSVMLAIKIAKFFKKPVEEIFKIEKNKS